MPLQFDRKTLQTYVKRAPFGNRFTQSQADGLEAIVAMWERTYSHLDIRFLAYILATTFHETGGTMQPVREGFAKSDAAARKIIAKRAYGKPDPHTGHVYYGRGYVQLTWAENYATMGRLIGAKLVENPDLALEQGFALKILFEGMLKGTSGRGDFTGKALENYFNATKDDPEGARAIINGVDKKALIATYHHAFLDSLKAAEVAEYSGAPAPDTTPNVPVVDGANFFKDKTMLGAMAAGGGGIVSSALGAIGNPWALAAFAIVAIGLFLVITGRIEIRSKGGV